MIERFVKRAGLACTALSALLSGCTTHLPRDLDGARDPVPLEERVLDRIDIAGERPVFTSKQVDDECDYTEYECKTVLDGQEVFAFNYIRAKEGEGRRPVIFLYNILKDKHMVVTHLLADALADNGYDSVIVRQEWMLSRRWARPINSRVVPEGSEGRKDFDEYTADLARNVGRLVRYWLPEQEGLDGRFGFVGVSLGGMHAIGSAALFPDQTLTVAIMAGADNPELFRLSEEREVIRTRERLFEAYWLEYGDGAKDRLYEDLGSLDFTISDFARAVDTQKVRLMISLYDSSVPTSCQWRLYELLGRPESRTFPCGHYSMALFYLPLRCQLIDWLDEAFSNR